MLEEMGHRFCEGLLRLRTRFSGKDQAVSFPFAEDSNSPNEPTQESGYGASLVVDVVVLFCSLLL